MAVFTFGFVKVRPKIPLISIYNKSAVSCSQESPLKNGLSNFCILSFMFEFQITNGLQKAIHDNKRLREKLKRKYEEVLEFYLRLPPHHQADLTRFIPDIEQVMQRKKQELDSPECTILVAGKNIKFQIKSFIIIPLHKIISTNLLINNLQSQSMVQIYLHANQHT